MEILSELIESNKLHLYACEDGEIYGFLDAVLGETEICITCLYVEDKFRRLGIATRLLDELCDTVYTEGIPAGISLTYVKSPQLEILDAFMTDRFDFYFEEDSFEYQVRPQVWVENKMVKDLAARKPAGLKLNELTNKLTNEMVTFFEGYQLDVVPDEGDIGGYYNDDISFVAVDKEQIMAAILAKVSEQEKVVEISAVACQKDSRMQLLGLGSSLFAELIKCYKDYSLRFVVVNNAAEKLAVQLFGEELKKLAVRTSVWMEI